MKENLLCSGGRSRRREILLCDGHSLAKKYKKKRGDEKNAKIERHVERKSKGGKPAKTGIFYINKKSKQ